MGANYLNMTIKTTSEKKFRKRYQAVVDNDCYEYGHNPYSGSWCTIPDVIITKDPYPEKKKWTKKKIQMVHEWIMDHTDKWEPAYAVKTSTGYIVGGWAAS